MARVEQLESGAVWAWHERAKDPYIAVKVVEVIDATTVRADRVDSQGHSAITAHPATFRCLWDELDEYLREWRDLDARLRADQRDEFPDSVSPGLDAGSPVGRNSVAHVDRGAIARRGAPRVVYSLQAAADECGVSTQFLRLYVRRGDLIAHYAGSKMLILADDLRDWVRRLPFERE